MANRDYDRDYDRERRIPRGEGQPRPGPWRRWYNRPYYESEPNESEFDQQAWDREYNRPYYEQSGDWGRGTEGEARRRDYNQPYYRESIDSERNRGQSYNRGEWRREYNQPYYEQSGDFDYDRQRANQQLWARDDWDRRDWEQGDWARQNRQEMGRGSTRRWQDQGRSQTYNTPGRRQQDFGSSYRSDWDTESTPYYTYTEYWWIVPGPYEGIGPKGYERSDERIHEDICERLTEHGQIDPREVDIQVENGEVTLSGTVDSRREKRIAEDIAETVSGVRDVHNRLRVEQQQGQYRGSTGSRSYGTGPTSMGSRGMGQGQIRSGMEVIGSDGEHIGTVKEIRGNDFLIDRDLARDVYAPMSAGSVSGERVRLNIRSEEVNDQGWPNPDLIDTSDAGNQ